MSLTVVTGVPEPDPDDPEPKPRAPHIPEPWPKATPLKAWPRRASISPEKGNFRPAMNLHVKLSLIRWLGLDRTDEVFQIVPSHRFSLIS